MSFREKIAWASFISTVVIWGGYFAMVLTHSGPGHPHIGFLWGFIACVVLQVVVMAGVAIVAAILSPGDAKARIDERDRDIARRATGLAYYFVLAALLALIVILHMGFDIIQTIFALFAIVAVAEAIRFGAQAIGYRRNA